MDVVSNNDNTDYLDDIFWPNMSKEDVDSLLMAQISKAKNILDIENIKLLFDDWDMYRLLLLQCLKRKLIKYDDAILFITLLLQVKLVALLDNEITQYNHYIIKLKALHAELNSQRDFIKAHLYHLFQDINNMALTNDGISYNNWHECYLELINSLSLIEIKHNILIRYLDILLRINVSNMSNEEEREYRESLNYLTDIKLSTEKILSLSRNKGNGE